MIKKYTFLYISALALNLHGMESGFPVMHDGKTEEKIISDTITIITPSKKTYEISEKLLRKSGTFRTMLDDKALKEDKKLELAEDPNLERVIQLLKNDSLLNSGGSLMGLAQDAFIAEKFDIPMLMQKRCKDIALFLSEGAYNTETMHKISKQLQQSKVGTMIAQEIYLTKSELVKKKLISSCQKITDRKVDCMDVQDTTLAYVYTHDDRKLRLAVKDLSSGKRKETVLPKKRDNTYFNEVFITQDLKKIITYDLASGFLYVYDAGSLELFLYMKVEDRVHFLFDEAKIISQSKKQKTEIDLVTGEVKTESQDIQIPDDKGFIKCVQTKPAEYFLKKLEEENKEIFDALKNIEKMPKKIKRVVTTPDNTRVFIETGKGDIIAIDTTTIQAWRVKKYKKDNVNLYMLDQLNGRGFVIESRSGYNLEINNIGGKRILNGIIRAVSLVLNEKNNNLFMNSDGGIHQIDLSSLLDCKMAIAELLTRKVENRQSLGKKLYSKIGAFLDGLNK